MRGLIASLSLAAALAALVAALPAGAAVPKLSGVVGPGTNISLKQGSKAVGSLKAGKYSLVVNDRSPFHNFRLKGPGVNVATSVKATGAKTFPVTLSKGTYTIVCDPHKTMMKRTFTVR
jgi:plastocyanin